MYTLSTSSKSRYCVLNSVCSDIVEFRDFPRLVFVGADPLNLHVDFADLASFLASFAIVAHLTFVIAVNSSLDVCMRIFRSFDGFSVPSLLLLVSLCLPGTVLFA